MAEAASLAALASRFIQTEQVPWIETAPGNKMKVIYHDPATGMLTILSKLEPGSGIPAHVHEDRSGLSCSKARWSMTKASAPPATSSSAPKAAVPPKAPNGCTMLVFFMKPTEGLKQALLKHA